ncbi:MAG: galactose mutarotase, partial [Chitinophagaceae bacterium]|nr:galactose mutarotase [Chitinophagaceae bacterium]
MIETKAIHQYILTNGTIDVVLCNYGCTIVSVNVPDKTGRKSNVVAGFSNPEDYQKDHPYFGSTVGRFANRIANGKFKIEDKEYQLTTNDQFNHLHGGIQGFHRKVWQAEENGDGITFTYLSRDGEEGFPGNLRVSVHFSLSDGNKL